jgi:hypothetical protein
MHKGAYLAGFPLHSLPFPPSRCRRHIVVVVASSSCRVAVVVLSSYCRVVCPWALVVVGGRGGGVAREVEACDMDGGARRSARGGWEVEREPIALVAVL